MKSLLICFLALSTFHPIFARISSYETDVKIISFSFSGEDAQPLAKALGLKNMAFDSRTLHFGGGLSIEAKVHGNMQGKQKKFDFSGRISLTHLGEFANGQREEGEPMICLLTGPDATRMYHSLRGVSEEKGHQAHSTSKTLDLEQVFIQCEQNFSEYEPHICQIHLDPNSELSDIEQESYTRVGAP